MHTHSSFHNNADFAAITSGTNVPNSSQRSDGYYTVGMQDFNFQIPDNRIVGCAADCGDLTYPDPTPGSDPITPIPSGT